MGAPLSAPEFWFEIPEIAVQRSGALLAQSVRKHIGETLTIVALEWNESRRKGREFMTLPDQEHAW